MARPSPAYEPRSPAQGALYQIVHDHFETFRARAASLSIRCSPMPTFRYYPQVPYYKGLAQEGLKSPAANDSFAAFLAIKKNGDEAGGLVADARKRLTP